MGTNCKKAKNNIAELPLKPFAAAFTINVLSKKKRPDFLNFQVFYLLISIENLFIKFYKTNQ